MARFDIPPKTWDEVLAGYPENIGTLTRHIRDIVVGALPVATESVGGAKMMGYAQYWISNRQDVVAMISPEDEHVKLYVHHIRSDATGALKVEGTGKNARHVKLTSVDETAIAGLLQQVLDARAKS